MSEPQGYQVNNEGYGQPVYAVNEYGSGVALGRSVNEYGQQAYLVDRPGRGAQAVYFVDGPPPVSLEYIARQTIEEQQRYAAWASAQSAAMNSHNPIAQHLLQQS